MSTKLSIWDRVLRLVLSNKAYMLRSLEKERKVIETNAEKFSLEVSNVELSIVQVIEDLRAIEERQVDMERRKTALDIKIEGVGAEFQAFQNKKKFDQAKVKSDLLEELIEEQVGIEQSMANNDHRIASQRKNLKRMRRELNEMKTKLRDIEDNKNDLNSRYNLVLAMDKAQATMMMLESSSHAESVSSFGNKVRQREITLESQREVRNSSEDRQFELLEKEMEISSRLSKHTMKGIEQ